MFDSGIGASSKVPAAHSPTTVPPDDQPAKCDSRRAGWTHVDGVAAAGAPVADLGHAPMWPWTHVATWLDSGRSRGYIGLSMGGCSADLPIIGGYVEILVHGS